MRRILVSMMVLGSVWISAQKKEGNIDEVIVQGKIISFPYKKVNENMIIVSKEEIQNSPAKSIEELMSQFTGMDIQRRGANGVQSDISIRGGSFEQVLILINGIRMNDSQTGHNNMNIPIDLSNVERIEVIKGPAARRFGQNAYAGVINIITKVNDKEEVRISANGGDFETYNLGLAANFGTPKFSNFFQANTSSSEGYRYNTDYKINNVWYQNNYAIQDGSIKLQAGFSEKKFGANGFYASPVNQYEETQVSLVSAAYQQKLGNLNINSNVYWRRAQDMFLINRLKPELYRNMHIGNNLGGEINASYPSSLGITGLGVELRKEFLVSNNLGNRNRWVTQVFLEHLFSFFDKKLQVSPGISWANYSNAGNFFYPGLDVGLDVAENHKIYGNIARVHRVPSYTDLFYNDPNNEGNPYLKPENAISYEVGYRFQTKDWLASASAFGRNSNDAIDFVKQNSNEKWKTKNIGKVDTKGFEVVLQKNFQGFVKSVYAGYTFTDMKGTFEDNLYSKYALQNLKHQLVGKLENKIFGFTNQLIYKYMERVTLGSYHLLDEKLSYDFKNLNLYVLINNVTNTQYTESNLVPMPGRWFHVGFTYKIGL